MSDRNKTLNAQQANAAVEEALTRLERAIIDQNKKEKPAFSEQAAYIENLEATNKTMACDVETMKKHCIALKGGYEILEKKYKRLGEINESVAHELDATLHDIDQLIAQKSLH